VLCRFPKALLPFPFTPPVFRSFRVTFSPVRAMPYPFTLCDFYLLRALVSILGISRASPLALDWIPLFPPLYFVEAFFLLLTLVSAAHLERVRLFFFHWLSLIPRDQVWSGLARFLFAPARMVGLGSGRRHDLFLTPRCISRELPFCLVIA